MKKIVNGYLALVNKLLPAEKKDKKSAVGLDIGVNSCKMIEIDKSGQEYKLVSWAIESAEGGDLSKAIRRALDKTHVPSKAPFTSVSGKGTLIRYIDMPRMQIDDLKQSVAIEADKYFPFAQNQIYTDCYILNSEASNKKMNVLVAAAKKEIVDERMKFLMSLGLQGEFIGLNPVAVANVLYTFGGEQSADKEESAVAFIDMGESVSNLTILVGHLPRFTRDIYIGGRDLTKRISNALDVDLDAAEQLKFDPKDKTEEIINACDSTLLNLINEMRLSFDYFTTEHNFQISKLLLTGGASSMAGLEDYFTKNLDISVEHWDPLKQLTISEEKIDDELKKNSARLGVALGLALYQFS